MNLPKVDQIWVGHNGTRTIVDITDHKKNRGHKVIHFKNNSSDSIYTIIDTAWVRWSRTAVISRVVGQAPMTAKMIKLMSELWVDEYVELFETELVTAQALSRMGKLTYRLTKCNGEPMWEVSLIYER